MTQTFSTLRAANTARQAEWDPSDKITLAYRGNEMGGECGEAQNVIKKLERERLGIPGSRASIDQLAEELADVVICADLIAMGEGIDLDLAVAHKFNLTSEKVGLEARLAAAPYGWIANCVDGETHWSRGKASIWTEGGDEPQPATLEQLMAFAEQGAEIARHARTVMAYLQDDGPSVVPHLMDSDDNPGHRLRDALAMAESMGDGE